MSALSVPSIYEKTFAKTDKTDAILVVDGKKLHVSKALLSYHSDYFDTLFNSEFKEKSQAEIEIKEVEFEDFATLLSLVHPSPIPIGNNVFWKFLALAERFQLPAALWRLELQLMISGYNMHTTLRLCNKFRLNHAIDYSISLFKDNGDLRYFRDNYYKNDKDNQLLSGQAATKFLDKLNEIVNKVPMPATAKPPVIDDLIFMASDKTDAILVVDGHKMHVNKALLSYHSDYFNTLFNSEFKEKSQEEIEIKDIEFEDFATLLSLVHKKEPIRPTEENAEKLLELADRFLLPAAKPHLEMFLISTKIDRFEKIRIADKYQLEFLLTNGISKFQNAADLKLFSECSFYKELSANTKDHVLRKIIRFL